MRSQNGKKASCLLHETFGQIALLTISVPLTWVLC